MSRHVLALMAVVLLLTVSAGLVAAAELPALGVRLEQTTVSGLSSGAYMAGQMQLAHSDIVTGAGLVAGGPWGCAESLYADAMPGPAAVFLNVGKAVNGCMLDGLRILGIPDPEKLAGRARKLAAEGRIDRIDNLSRARIYLFAGREDRTVAPSIVADAARLYRLLGVPQAAIRHVSNVAAGHGFVTADKGHACASTAAPYLVDCDYDQAGDLLAHILGPLAARTSALSSAVETFDQAAYARGLSDPSLSGEGMLYVPASCRTAAGCRVHVAYHGCSQSRTAVGDSFVAHAGYLAWADSNRLVLLFPQAAQSALNPQGCWDWWGYTGRDYLTRQAPQIEAVHRMLLRLAER
jgi:hypothetical protein